MIDDLSDMVEDLTQTRSVQEKPVVDHDVASEGASDLANSLESLRFDTAIWGIMLLNETV